ncbi:MAG: hypothetical protein JWR18_3082 [Segetibacter sp.]|jgi:hypothetical protein|nr:hypothetical protein [Segetibacter sp.]
METTFTAVDYAIISACIHNHRKSQKKLFTLIAPIIYTEILKDGYAPIEAEEILKQVFIEIFSTIENYKSEDLFDDWCMEIYERIKKASF